jgi:Tfp pilus assembly protein PilN
MKYAVNLIRNLRAEEKKRDEKRGRIVMMCTACFGILMLAVLFSVLEVFRIMNTLSEETVKLKRIEQEYKQYTVTNTFIDKADIELLDKLQNKKIFWTRKIAAMAAHLPENYWITRFDFKRGLFTVSGYGYISTNQEQLITIDDYLNMLRSDRLFSDVLRNIYLTATERTDEETGERVSFEYMAMTIDSSANKKKK